MSEERLLQALLYEKFDKSLASSIEKLPQSMATRVQQAMAAPMISVKSVFFDPMMPLQLVHPSWYEEIFSSFSPHIQACYKKLFASEYGSFEQKTPLVMFLLKRCVLLWKDRDIPPVHTLENQPLYWMLYCSKDQIEQIIDLLGVSEAVDAMRKVVDRKQLELILLSLTAVQQRYLRYLLLQKSEPISSKEDFLAVIRQQALTSKQYLHERGLLQLCALIAVQEKIWQWHFFHRLEKAYAERLLEKMGQIVREPSVAVIEKRVIRIKQFLDKG